MQPNAPKVPGGSPFGASALGGSSSASSSDATRFLPLTHERVTYLRDMMRDVGSYVESKDFEQGLPITNFERYHELWAMDEDEDEEEEYEEDSQEYQSAEED